MSGPNRNSKRAAPARRTAKPSRQAAGAERVRSTKTKAPRAKAASAEERPRLGKTRPFEPRADKLRTSGEGRRGDSKPFKAAKPSKALKPFSGERPARTGERPARTGAPRAAKPFGGERPARTGERPARTGAPRTAKPFGGERPARLGKGAPRAERPGLERRGGTEVGRYQGKPRAGESKPYVRKVRGEGKPLASESKPQLGRGHRADAPRAKRVGTTKTGASNPRARNARGTALDTRGKRPVRPDTRKASATPRVADARALGGDIRATGKRQFYAARPGKGEAEAAPVLERSLPRVPVALSQLASKEPHSGMWIFTTREGSEQDLVDELILAKVVDPAPRVIAPSLVLSPKIPKREGRPMELTFARQGFEIMQAVNSLDLDEKTKRIVGTLRKQLAEAKQYALHVWVPDSTEANPLSSLADELDGRIEAELSRALPELTRIDDATLRRASVKLAQVCVLDTERAVAGIMHANRTPSLARGGRTRVRITGDFPSRAARKIEEALAWLGVAPGPGEVCVDLGAAPGGWTYMLAERRARVIAVDPAKLRPDILARKGVRHVMDSAFTFQPDEHVDWLFCDMAWRPLEVAALLAKWGRKHWARIVVANIKLPMTKKAEILARIRTILEVEGEWKHVRVKQLYHDREEITLTAVRA